MIGTGKKRKEMKSLVTIKKHHKYHEAYNDCYQEVDYLIRLVNVYREISLFSMDEDQFPNKKKNLRLLDQQVNHMLKERNESH